MHYSRSSNIQTTLESNNPMCPVTVITTAKCQPRYRLELLIHNPKSVRLLVPLQENHVRGNNVQSHWKSWEGTVHVSRLSTEICSVRLKCAKQSFMGENQHINIEKMNHVKEITLNYHQNSVPFGKTGIFDVSNWTTGNFPTSHGRAFT